MTVLFCVGYIFAPQYSWIIAKVGIKHQSIIVTLLYNIRLGLLSLVISSVINNLIMVKFWDQEKLSSTLYFLSKQSSGVGVGVNFCSRVIKNVLITASFRCFKWQSHSNVLEWQYHLACLEYIPWFHIINHSHIINLQNCIDISNKTDWTFSKSCYDDNPWKFHQIWFKSV